MLPIMHSPSIQARVCAAEFAQRYFGDENRDSFVHHLAVAIDRDFVPRPVDSSVPLPIDPVLAKQLEAAKAEVARVQERIDQHSWSLTHSHLGRWDPR